MGNASCDIIVRQFDCKKIVIKEIRAVWEPEEEEWYFSIADVADALAVVYASTAND